MENDSLDTWMRFLDPEVLRPSLMLASIYIATYEILKDSIIGRIKDFYVTGFNEGGEIVDEDYQSKVLNRNKSVLYASLEWLRESDAITDDDIEVFKKVKQCRNNIAHEISRMLSEGLPKDFADRFGDMTSLITKVERWWIVYFEIPLNPEVANIEVNEDEIVPGPIAGLKMMIDVALGDDEKSKYYINEFRKIFPDHKFSS